jgi:hypothetical protein
MKNLFFILTATLFFACNSAPTTPEDFGKAVFDAVKSNDDKSLKNLFLTEEEYGDIIDQSTLSEDKKNLERGKAIGLNKNMEGLAVLSMESVQRIAGNYNIDWSKANFKTVHVIPGNEFGIEGAHYIDVIFEYNGFEYVLNIGDSFKTKNGWKTFKELSMSNYSPK